MEEGTLGTAWAPRGPSCSGEKGQVEWVKPAGGGGFFSLLCLRTEKEEDLQWIGRVGFWAGLVVGCRWAKVACLPTADFPFFFFFVKKGLRKIEIWRGYSPQKFMQILHLEFRHQIGTRFLNISRCTDYIQIVHVHRDYIESILGSPYKDTWAIFVARVALLMKEIA